MSIVDGRKRNLMLQTGILKAHTMTPWAPVVIRLAVAILPGGDATLILDSKTPRSS